jgi:hypothetical protein
MIPGVLVIKKVHISKYPISNGYRVMTAGNLETNLRIIEKIKLSRYRPEQAHGDPVG